MAPRLYRSSSLVLVSVTLIASTLGLASPASAVVCADTVAGLLSRWPGDDSTAEVAHARDGTLVNGTYAPGKVANAFSFDGVGDTVTAPDNTDWALGGDFTVDTWVNFTSVPVAGHIAFVAHDEGNGYHPKWIFWWKDTGQLSFHFNTGSATVDPVSYSWTPTTGTWYHVAVTRAGSTFTLYLNGTSVATGSETTAIPDAAGPLTLGSAENNYFLDGLLDEPEDLPARPQRYRGEGDQRCRRQPSMCNHAVDTIGDGASDRISGRHPDAQRHARPIRRCAGRRPAHRDHAEREQRHPRRPAGRDRSGRRFLQPPGRPRCRDRGVPRVVCRFDERVGRERDRDGRPREGEVCLIAVAIEVEGDVRKFRDRHRPSERRLHQQGGHHLGHALWLV